MNEKPILFSTPMVQAILAGRKTMTRRIVKIQPYLFDPHGDAKTWVWKHIAGLRPYLSKEMVKHCPYGTPGDHLWVRETWAGGEDYGTIIYKASGTPLPKHTGARWHPSIHMFRRFSRITLEVTGVRVERLQEITEDDAWKEGVHELVDKKRPYIDKWGGTPAKAAFSNLWESINGKKYPWGSNPFVWVIEFSRIK
jgi:hypothetical protein